jgi:hypothetical protein
LGQLAPDDDRAVAERVIRCLKRREQAVRRFEKHNGRIRLAQRLEEASARARLARREALEAEPMRGQPRDRKHRRHRACAWDRHDTHARLMRRRYQRAARVRDAWRARVRHQRDRLALLQAAHELLDAPCA